MRGVWRLSLSGVLLFGGVSLGSVPVAAAAPVDSPGTVIASAPVGQSERLGSSGRRFTYWTRGPHGPVTSTAVVYVPAGPAPAGGWPVIGYAHGTRGMADQCAFTANLNPDANTEVGQLFPRLVAAGYAVVATDYAGLGTPGTPAYLDGPSQARNVIDAVRAARSIEQSLGTRWASFGNSQGGQTAVMTAYLAPREAPELDFRGGAAAGVPSNLELLFRFSGPGLPPFPIERTATYASMILAGLRANAPELNIDSYLTPLGRHALDVVESSCEGQAIEQLRNLPLNALFSRSLNDSRVQARLTAMLQIPTAGYSVPLFLAQGVQDTTVPAPLTAKLVGDMVHHGTQVTARVYPGGHGQTYRDAAPDMLAFLGRVFVTH